jgi:antitoxin component HigA of HigAB toxin-antitoxin module
MIENDLQHKAALDEATDIMMRDADPLADSPDGIRLMQLSNAIDSYERKKYPMLYDNE